MVVVVRYSGSGWKVIVMIFLVVSINLVIVMIDISEVFLIRLIRVLFIEGMVMCIVCGMMM